MVRFSLKNVADLKPLVNKLAGDDRDFLTPASDPNLMVRLLLASKVRLRHASEDFKVGFLSDWSQVLAHFSVSVGVSPPTGIFLDRFGVINTRRAHTLLLQFADAGNASAFLSKLQHGDGSRLFLTFDLIDGALQLVSHSERACGPSHPEMPELLGAAEFQVSSACLGRRRTHRMPYNMRPPSIPTSNAVQAAEAALSDMRLFHVRYTNPGKYACGQPAGWRPGDSLVVDKTHSFRLARVPVSSTIASVRQLLCGWLGVDSTGDQEIRVLPDSIDKQPRPVDAGYNVHNSLIVEFSMDEHVKKMQNVTTLSLVDESGLTHEVRVTALGVEGGGESMAIGRSHWPALELS